MTTLWTGVLNAGERFALGAAVPIAIPVVSALAIVVGGGRIGIAALAGGTVVGYAIAAWAVAAAARQRRLEHHASMDRVVPGSAARPGAVRAGLRRRRV